MKFSVLDLAYLREGESFKDAYDNLVNLAQSVEKFGYERYWIAEHHNSSAVGSSATQLLILHTLANTKTIRVGSGGVMLPNHSPYLVAEQYGTIESLYPNRLDMGIGRAPGTDLKTAIAIRRPDSPHYTFEKQLEELESYFVGNPDVNAYPAKGIEIPKYILGSSVESAYLASKLGLPYAFASHFAPTNLKECVKIYRDNFKPSKWLDKPYVIVGINAFVADTDEEAKILSTSQIQAVLGLVTSGQKPIQSPKDEEEIWNDFIRAEKVPHFGPIAFEKKDIVNQEKEIVNRMMSCCLIGSKETVCEQLRELKNSLEFEELIVNSIIYDKEKQIKSYKLLAEVIKENF